MTRHPDHAHCRPRVEHYWLGGWVAHCACGWNTYRAARDEWRTVLIRALSHTGGLRP